MARRRELFPAAWRRLALAMAAVGVLGGCAGGVPRNPVPASLANDVEPLGEAGLREWGDALRPDEMDAIIARQMPLLQARFGAEIAAGRRKGRLLYIGTTNLDAGRPVIWDIGAIAESGHPGALDLVRELIRASSAIPVAFPPIFVPVETADGRAFDEMHVDGDASSQVTFVSPAVTIAAATRAALGRNLDRRLWVIVNNDLAPPHRQLRPASSTSAGRRSAR